MDYLFRFISSSVIRSYSILRTFHAAFCVIVSSMFFLVSCSPTGSPQFDISAQPTTKLASLTETLEPLAVTNSPPPRQATWTSLTNGNYIRALFIDHEGFLWSGGNGGVARWDIDSGNYTKYTASDGLPGNFVTSIAQTKDGAMWFGTFGGGVARFDGQSWKTFSVQDGLPDDRILSLASSPDGSIWAGTLYGIAYYDGNAWSLFESEEISDVESLAITSDQTVWVGGDWQTGLKRIKDGKIEDFSEYLGDDGLVTALSIAPDGTLWVGTHYSVVHYDGKIWQKQTLSKDELVAVSSITVTADGEAWVGFSAWMGYSEYDRPELTHAYNQGLVNHLPGVWHFDGVNWNLVTANDGLLENDIRAITTSEEDGNVWFGHTTKGVSRFDGQEWTIFQVPNEIPSNQISKIAIAPNGDIWFSQPGLGLHHFDGEKWDSYTEIKGLSLYVLSIHVDQDGTVWIGTSDGVAKLESGQWTIYRKEDYEWMANIRSIVELSNGTHLFGMDGAAILDGLNWMILPLNNEIGVKAIEGTDDRLWFVTAINGVFAFDSTKWEHFTGENGLPSGFINGIAAAPDGTVWFTSCDNIFYFDKGTWKTYLKKPENATDYCVGGDIAIDGKGNIWVGSNHGLIQIEGPKMITYTIYDGLASNSISSVVVGYDGMIWIGTDAGISTFQYPTP